MKHYLPFCLLFLLGNLHSVCAQTTQGFSSQIQPSIVFQTAYIRETLRDSLLAGKLPKDKKGNLLSIIYPQVVTQVDADRTKDVVAPTAGVDISADDRLMAVYDNVTKDGETRQDLAWWLPQIIADGDFNRVSGVSDQASPKAGTIGVDAVRMKAIYKTYTYEGKDDNSSKDLPKLTGHHYVYIPQFTFTMLFTLFGQGTPLSTGVKPGAGLKEHATRDVTRAFGQTLLIPGGLTQGGNSGLLSFSWLPLPEKPVSLEASLLYSHTTWSTRDSTTAVNILAPSIGIGYRVFGRYLNKSQNQTQVRLFARFQLRHLFGDIETQPRLLLDVFQSTQRTYHGLDIGATASISALRVTISGGLYNGDIEGFSHGQVVYGLGLAAGIRL